MVTLKQSEFARAMNVSRKTITIWKSEGRIVMVGDRVDVEASRERLLRYAARPETLTSAKRLGNVPVEQLKSHPKYQSGVTYDNPANLPDEVVECSAAIETGATILVEVLLPHMPVAVICGVACDWVNAMRHGWVGDASGTFASVCDIDWPAPPIGLSHWREHDYFTSDPLGEVDWASLAEDHPKEAADMPREYLPWRSP